MEDFESVYREYFRDVELYIFALCRDEKLAAELASQAFFTALEQYPKFRGECHVRTWLCGIGSLAMCYGLCQGIVCGFTFASFFVEQELLWAVAMSVCLWGALMCIRAMRRKA